MQNANKNANDGDKVCICRGFALFYKGSNPSYSAKREAPESVDSGAFLCIAGGLGGFGGFRGETDVLAKKPDFGL